MKKRVKVDRFSFSFSALNTLKPPVFLTPSAPVPSPTSFTNSGYNFTLEPTPSNQPFSFTQPTSNPSAPSPSSSIQNLTPPTTPPPITPPPITPPSQPITPSKPTNAPSQQPPPKPTETPKTASEPVVEPSFGDKEYWLKDGSPTTNLIIAIVALIALFMFMQN